MHHGRMMNDKVTDIEQARLHMNTAIANWQQARLVLERCGEESYAKAITESMGDMLEVSGQFDEQFRSVT